MKKLHTTLAKSGSVLLGLTTAVSATDPAIRKKIFGSGTINEEIDYIIK